MPNTWKVCPDCHGEGKHALHGIAFTADEMEEQGPDFREDYMSGFYDTVCETCGGRRVVTPEEEQLFQDCIADERVRRQESGWF